MPLNSVCLFQHFTNMEIYFPCHSILSCSLYIVQCTHCEQNTTYLFTCIFYRNFVEHDKAKIHLRINRHFLALTLSVQCVAVNRDYRKIPVVFAISILVLLWIFHLAHCHYSQRFCSVPISLYWYVEMHYTGFIAIVIVLLLLLVCKMLCVLYVYR